MDYLQAQVAQTKVVHYFNKGTSSLPIYAEAVNKVITLRNIQGRLTNAATVIPTKSATTGELLGVERLSQAQKDGKAYAVDPRRRLKITDGTTFDLSDDVQRIDWNWVQYSPYIVHTKEDALKSPGALFYVEDTERDTNAKLKKSEIFYAAEKLVRETWSEPVRMNRARLLGHDLSMHTPGEVLEYLLDFVRQSPQNAQLVLSIENDPFKNERLELLRWKDVGLVEIKNGGTWYYAEYRMGVSEDSAIAWVLQAEHGDIVRSIRDRFALMQRPNLSGVQAIPTRGGLSPALGADGRQLLPPRSTSVEPIMTPPRPAPAPGGLTIEKVKEIAPSTYADFEAAQGAGIIAYLSENPDQDLFKQMVAQEMARNMQERRQNFQRPAPAAAPEQREVTGFHGQQVNAAAVPDLGSVSDAFGDDEEEPVVLQPAQGAGYDERQVGDQVVSGDAAFEAVMAEQQLPLVEQADHEGAADIGDAAPLAVPTDEQGQPLKGLALLNHQRAAAAAARRQADGDTEA